MTQQTKIGRILSTINSDARICFAAAAGCLIVGAMGRLFNFVFAAETSLEALLVVGAFYMLLGATSLSRRGAKVETGLDPATSSSPPPSRSTQMVREPSFRKLPGTATLRMGDALSD